MKTNYYSKMPGFIESGKVMYRGIAKYLNRITASYLNPKVKSSRLAALRKQYEAFLEEDKNRKQRNDFILGCLDKMRLNSLVPVKKGMMFRECPNAVYRPAPIYQGLHINKPQGYELQKIESQQNITASMGNSKSALLEEVGKKYILIPRSSTTVTEVTSKAGDTDITAEKHNNDWKSKYHILDELKRAEKEGLEVYSKNDQFSINEHQHDTTGFREQNDDTPVHEKGIDHEPMLKYKEEEPEKDILYKQADYGIHNYREKSDDNNENKEIAMQSNDQSVELSFNNYLGKPNETHCHTPQKQIESSKAGNEFMPLYSSQTKLGRKVSEFNEDKKANCLLKEDSAAQDTNSSNATETPNASEITTIETSTFRNEETKQVNDEVTFENYEDKYRDVEKVCPRDIKTIIQDVSSVAAKDEDYSQYPLEAINTQKITTNDGVILKDDVNINPEGHTHNDSYVNSSNANSYDPQPSMTKNVTQPELTHENAPQPAPSSQNYVQPLANEEDSEQPAVQNFDIEQIQEFEAEQENLFYQEPNAAYDQITGDTGNVQGENYQANEQYQYYEGVEQEQHNPVEINEHEEATERYDPSFQAQYDPAQYDYPQEGYEKQGYEEQSYEQQEHMYEQPIKGYTAPQGEFGEPAKAYNFNQLPQQYEETENYKHQVPYEKGFDSVQSLERQLDKEESYTEAEQGQGESKAVEQTERIKQNS